MASKAMIRKIVNATYEQFVKLMDSAPNVVDLVVEVDDVFKATIEENAKQKKVIETDSKHIKEAQEDLREHVLKYIEDKGLDRLDGIKAKSITYTPAKTERGIESWREIMVSGKYVPLATLSNDDLVEMLEKKGVKVRSMSRPAVRQIPASIRVNR